MIVLVVVSSSFANVIDSVSIISSSGSSLFPLLLLSSSLTSELVAIVFISLFTIVSSLLLKDVTLFDSCFSSTDVSVFSLSSVLVVHSCDSDSVSSSGSSSYSLLFVVSS